MRFMQYNRMICLVKSGIHANLQLGSQQCSALCTSQSLTVLAELVNANVNTEKKKIIIWKGKYSTVVVSSEIILTSAIYTEGSRG